MTRVIITGASGGIGGAAAELLRERGARVTGLDLHADGDGVIQADVTDQASIDAAMAEATEHLGGLDVLVNCAGIGGIQDAGARPDDRALQILEVNLLGAWRVTAAAMPALLESRGRVVNVASGLAAMSTPFAAAYCMSKRGLVAYSDVLRLEYGDSIGVTTVYPGYIKTGIHDPEVTQGLSLDQGVRAEPVSTAANAIAQAALGKPVRDLPTSTAVRILMAIARSAPRLVDRVVARGSRRMALGGGFDSSAIARAYRDRLSR
jgi:NAD(P)-dependent dehydrogenase (short-subunit alcohol dehydrogenase family)